MRANGGTVCSAARRSRQGYRSGSGYRAKGTRMPRSQPVAWMGDPRRDPINEDQVLMKLGIAVQRI